MDREHFHQLLSQRLRPPTHFQMPPDVIRGISLLADGIDELPLPPDGRGSLLGGLLNVCEYIDQACRHFVPPVAPVPPPAPVSEPEPAPVTEQVAEQSAETAEQSDPAGEAVSEPVTGEPVEQVTGQEPDKPAT